MNKKHLPHACLFAAIITSLLQLVLLYSANYKITHWKAVYWLLLDNSQVFARFAILYYVAMNFSAWRSPDKIRFRFTACMALLFMALYFTTRSIVSLMRDIPFFLSSTAHGPIFSWWSNYSNLAFNVFTQWLIPLLLLSIIIHLANYLQELKEDTFVEYIPKSHTKTFWPAMITLAVVFFSSFVNVVLSHTETLKNLIFYTNGLFNEFIIGQPDVFHGYTIFSCTSVITLIAASFLGLRDCPTHYFDKKPALYKSFLCAALLMILWLTALILSAYLLQAILMLQISPEQHYTAYFQLFIFLWIMSTVMVYGICRLFTMIRKQKKTPPAQYQV